MSAVVTTWQVFSADRHHVATYSTQGGAAAHVASWPALYYTEVQSLTPVDSPIGLSSPTISASEDKTVTSSHGHRRG